MSEGVEGSGVEGRLIVRCVHCALQSRPADSASISAADSSLRLL